MSEQREIGKRPTSGPPLCSRPFREVFITIAGDVPPLLLHDDSSGLAPPFLGAGDLAAGIRGAAPPDASRRASGPLPGLAGAATRAGAALGRIPVHEQVPPSRRLPPQRLREALVYRHRAEDQTAFQEVLSARERRLQVLRRGVPWDVEFPVGIRSQLLLEEPRVTQTAEVPSRAHCLGRHPGDNDGRLLEVTQLTPSQPVASEHPGAGTTCTGTPSGPRTRGARGWPACQESRQHRTAGWCPMGQHHGSLP